MNSTDFRFTRDRPDNTPEELARYTACPSFLRDTMINIDRQMVSPALSKLRRLEHHLGYLNGRASYAFNVIWTKTFKGKRIELIHNAAGEPQAYIIKSTREVRSLTESEKRQYKNDPNWSYFTSD